MLQAVAVVFLVIYLEELSLDDPFFILIQSSMFVIMEHTWSVILLESVKLMAAGVGSHLYAKVRHFSVNTTAEIFYNRNGRHLKSELGLLQVRSVHL